MVMRTTIRTTLPKLAATTSTILSVRVPSSQACRRTTQLRDGSARDTSRSLFGLGMAVREPIHPEPNRRSQMRAAVLAPNRLRNTTATARTCRLAPPAACNTTRRRRPKFAGNAARIRRSSSVGLHNVHYRAFKPCDLQAFLYL